MPISITPLHPVFGAALRGLDLTAPLTNTVRRTVEETMDRYGITLLPEQFIDDQQQVDFTSLFGRLEVSPVVRGANNDGGRKLRVNHREVFDVSNLDPYGAIQTENDERRLYRLANELWHTDSSFRQASASYSMLSARIVPPVGADTQFVDTRAAYDALPPAMKAKVEGLTGEHSIWRSRMQYGYIPTEEEKKLRPSAFHPLVRIHPGSKRKMLYIASHITRIVGLSEADGRALLDELIAFATRPEMVYSHKWRVGDIVIWDNRCTMHRATPFPDATSIRDMRRTTVIDEAAAPAPRMAETV